MSKMMVFNGDKKDHQKLMRYLYFFTVLLIGCSNHQTKKLSFWEEPVTAMEFVLIPKGDFYMGNPAAKSENHEDETQHSVSLTQDFWLARMEVTQEQWQIVMGHEEPHPEKPSPFRNEHPKYPVVSVSYDKVQSFLRKLEKLSPGNRFRLPTEAEWEYACRAGSVTTFYTGTHISDSLATFNTEIPSAYSSIGKYIGHPTPVGSYPCNSWGLYDMHGNVWEWVVDWYSDYTSAQVSDPKGPENGTYKIIRGGSWYFGADNARSFTRRTHEPKLWGYSIGFRIVREKDQ